MPFHLENRLCTHWGYAVEKREYNPEPYVLYKKLYISDKKGVDDDAGVKRTIRASVNDNVVPLKKGAEPEFNLTAWQKKQLNTRCDNIVGLFPDPYTVPLMVRARLKIIQQNMLPEEVKFVEHYMEENFPI
jgi:hypothetical protein